jgi:hypothetical protein
MLATSFTQHGSQTGGAHAGFETFPWSHALQRVEQPEVDAVFGGFAGLGKIPARRNSAVVSAVVQSLGHEPKLQCVALGRDSNKDEH